jgi:hypothetical protein
VDEMGREYTTNEKRKAYKLLVGKAGEKRPLQRP